MSFISVSLNSHTLLPMMIRLGILTSSPFFYKELSVELLDTNMLDSYILFSTLQPSLVFLLNNPSTDPLKKTVVAFK